MKTFKVTIQGTADLLMNAFPMEQPTAGEKGSTKATVAKDWSQEWREKLYALDDGTIYQPEAHLIGALVKAAVTEKIPGRRGKTYRDAVKGGVFIEPACIPHEQVRVADFEEAPVITGPAPEGFKERVYVDRRPVRVQRARVIRLRPALCRGWQLKFQLQTLDNDFRIDALKSILDTAGREVGIGDFRPRFGRFIVTNFEEVLES